METTDKGMVMVLRPVQPKKVALPMETTDDGIQMVVYETSHVLQFGVLNESHK